MVITAGTNEHDPRNASELLWALQHQCYATLMNINIYIYIYIFFFTSMLIEHRLNLLNHLLSPHFCSPLRGWLFIPYWVEQRK